MSSRAYLSIIQWPDNATEDWCATRLQSAAGLDVHAARQAVRRGAPQVVCLLPLDEAERAVEALGAAGIMAMAAGRDAMRSMPEPIRAKRLLPAEGAPEPMFAVEAWRGPGLAFKAAEVFLLVRASLRTTVTRSDPGGGDSPGRPSRIATALFLGPTTAAAAEAFDTPTPSRTSKTTLREVLDLHLVRGARIRIGGDKFNFGLLGAKRGYTDRDNTDALAVLLAELAPRAIVDTSFSRFRCPPDIARQHFQAEGQATVQRTSDDPAFDFYSSWAAMMYRTMLG